jgi:low affinity Fe/Cu permease
MNSTSWFARFAKSTSRAAGRPVAFALAASTIVLWAVTGPLFGFSDTWQLIINTSTTIVTFLMVFLIQHTQNRDAEAVQVKLDELIRVTEGAHNVLLDLEDIDEEKLDAIRASYAKLAERARRAKTSGRPDTDIPDIAVDHGDDTHPDERDRPTAKRLQRKKG